MSFPIENRAFLPQEEFAAWERLLATHTSIRHALDYFLKQSPPVAPTDAVAQDEYSHDILFPVSKSLWIVYDCS